MSTFAQPTLRKRVLYKLDDFSMEHYYELKFFAGFMLTVSIVFGFVLGVVYYMDAHSLINEAEAMKIECGYLNCGKQIIANFNEADSLSLRAAVCSISALICSAVGIVKLLPRL